MINTCGGILLTCDDTKSHALFICTVPRYTGRVKSLCYNSVSQPSLETAWFLSLFFLLVHSENHFKFSALSICFVYCFSNLEFWLTVTWLLDASDIFIIHGSAFDLFLQHQVYINPVWMFFIRDCYVIGWCLSFVLKK